MAPRRAEANEAIHDARRGAILSAALAAFVERGFDGTRMQEIAGRCAMSYGLVYHYFPNKEAVFTTLVDQALEAAGSLIRTLPENPNPRALGSFVGIAVSDPAPLYFSLIVEALTKKGVPAELAARTRAAVRSFASALGTAGNGDSSGTDGARGEGILAILLGASILKVCGVSNGRFAIHVATVLAAASGD